MPYIGQVRLRELGTARLREWHDQVIADGASPATVSNVVRTTSAGLGAAVRDGLIPSNPLLGLPRPGVLRAPRKALSAEPAELIRAKLPTQADRVLWGLLYAAGLRTEEALALRWSGVRELSPKGGTLAVDRTVVSGHVRETTKTGRGRDVSIVATLAADLLDLHAQVSEGSTEADPETLVVPPRQDTPLNLNDWRNRVLTPAVKAAGLGWATPYTGRHSYISLQVHAGPSPVIVAALAGNSPEVIWKHYARAFDRARTTKPAPLAEALQAARDEIARTDVPTTVRA